MAKDPNYNDSLSNRWLNLADQRLGTQVLFATDDFFAEKENLILPGRGIFIPDKYTDRGKWMDGWESRRKRVPGNDYCIIKLGARGRIAAFDIDTNHFLGNHPPFASVDICDLLKGQDPDQNTKWQEVLPKSELKPGSQNLFELKSESPCCTHVRLQIYPDGGVARFRVYGIVEPDWKSIDSQKQIDLVSVFHGGTVVTCNDMFFSSKDNLIMPGRGKDMGDGWETKRRRTPGHDWCILRLGRRGKVEKVEIDTAHFKGNYPDRFSLDFVDTTETQWEKFSWSELLGEQKLKADAVHEFSVKPTCATFLRLNIFPDGGISRLRVYGNYL